jgi:cobalt/nickel transport system permease protein
MHHDFIDRYSRLNSPVHSLDPRAKIIALFTLIIVCVITPPNEWWPFCIYAAIVVIIAAASRLPAKYLLTRVLVVLPFVLVVAIFMPFMHKGGPSYDLGLFSVSREGLIILWGVAIKALISVSCLILLSATTPFNDLMHGFERLHVPRFFTTTSALMYRYIFVIIDEAERMGRARDSRNFRGQWLWHAGVVGRMAGTLFLRSQERAERVYNAMSSRGFDGTFPRWQDGKMKAADYIFIAMVAATAIAARLVVLWK